MGRFREGGSVPVIFRTKKNYWHQAITRKERVAIFLKACGISAITGWLFYHKIWSFIVVFPFGLWLYRNMETEKIEEKKSSFLLQFKEMTESVAAALNVGYSAENAFKEAKKEMKVLYIEKSMISTELDFIVRKIYRWIPPVGPGFP